MTNDYFGEKALENNGIKKTTNYKKKKGTSGTNVKLELSQAP